MHFSTAFVALATAVTAVFVAATPVQNTTNQDISYGNPDLVTDQGNRFKINYGSQNGHPNACPGHYICYIYHKGVQTLDVSLGDPDDFVDEGSRWRLNYGSRDGHDNACPGHFICYFYK